MKNERMKKEGKKQMSDVTRIHYTHNPKGAIEPRIFGRGIRYPRPSEPGSRSDRRRGFGRRKSGFGEPLLGLRPLGPQGEDPHYEHLVVGTLQAGSKRFFGAEVRRALGE